MRLYPTYRYLDYKKKKKKTKKKKNFCKWIFRSGRFISCPKCTSTAKFSIAVKLAFSSILSEFLFLI